MKRLNITMPDELAKEIEDFPNKSRFIAQALREKLQRMRKKKLNKLLEKGYKTSREEDHEIDKEWENITLENWE